jgi:phosphoglucosamine mutase
VLCINKTPNGLNINDGCGSTHMAGLQAAVVENGAGLGIALDGDADRCLAVDAAGNLIDGDKILAILALQLKAEGRLHNDTLVATVMSNLGLLNAMRANGIHVEQTRVGDRYVLEAMAANGFTLGGEQSGHVIISEYASTGDGVLTGLHLASCMATTGRTLADLASVVTTLPQVMINVPNVDKMRAGIDPEITQAVTAANRELGHGGRVLLRPSGTEPLVRVMVEATTLDQAQQVAERLAGLVSQRLAL